MPCSEYVNTNQLKIVKLSIKSASICYEHQLCFCLASALLPRNFRLASTQLPCNFRGISDAPTSQAVEFPKQARTTNPTSMSDFPGRFQFTSKSIPNSVIVMQMLELRIQKQNAKCFRELPRHFDAKLLLRASTRRLPASVGICMCREK